jgi:ribonucleoside-diphosphate reductase alpha chain
MKAMSHMYRAAWRAGLKTTYYLRTLGASTIEKATVSAVAEVPEPVAAAVAVAAVARVEPSLEAAACSLEAMMNGEECEACQ